MTDTPILDQIKWPETEQDATADALVKHGAMVAMVMSRENHDRMRAAYKYSKDDPERAGALREWVQGLAGEIAEAQVAVLLNTIQTDAPDRADELARMLWRYTEDGGLLYELMFDLLDARGIDAEGLRREIDAEADAETEEAQHER